MLRVRRVPSQGSSQVDRLLTNCIMRLFTPFGESHLTAVQARAQSALSVSGDPGALVCDFDVRATRQPEPIGSLQNVIRMLVWIRAKLEW